MTYHEDEDHQQKRIYVIFQNASWIGTTTTVSACTSVHLGLMASLTRQRQSVPVAITLAKLVQDLRTPSAPAVTKMLNSFRASHSVSYWNYLGRCSPPSGSIEWPFCSRSTCFFFWFWQFIWLSSGINAEEARPCSDTARLPIRAMETRVKKLIGCKKMVLSLTVNENEFYGLCDLRRNEIYEACDNLKINGRNDSIF